eukprot:TRINITY_DN9334_c0_g1_i3.p1 TRINITY_DN9334_c0_g1~~TRINITY_DN9334_c0_g1_i3.p1  ORF type:complete len:163 (+),score=24.80 TRINITY_DN9334_c0_g1_i3:117-605(+)
MSAKHTAAVLAAWGMFAGSHFAMSHPPIREKLVDTLGGEKPFLAAYSGVALVTSIPLIVVGKRVSAHYVPSTGLRNALAHTLKAAGAATLGLAMAQPSPSGIDAAQVEVTGINRITRHPLFGGFALWGLGNTLIAPGPMKLLWAGFPAFWLAGSAHQVCISI